MQHRLTHYFIGLYLTLCSLGQVQATTDPFEELVKTTTQRLNAQIKQNALNERLNQAHLNRYILYLGGKDWKNNNTDTSWVRDDTDETIRESQLKALDRQAKEGMFAQPYKDAGFHMVYIGDYTIHLNSSVSVEDLASLRTLDKLKDPKKVEAQHLARVNQNILSTIAKIKEGIEWTSFNRTNKMLYIYLRIRFVYSDSNYKTIAYRQLTGERSLGGKAQAYISEATRGNMYEPPIVYLKNKVPKLRDAIKEVMDGRAEIKEETPILASFDMNWNTSTSTSIDAQLLSGVGTVDEMTSQHAQNAQIEFMDYTGHYQANSAEQKNLRLFLNFDQQEPLAAYRLAKKIIIRVTNQNTPKEIRHAIAQFELPANAVLIWLDFDASKQSFNTRIRYGEGLRSQYLADQNAADRYLQAYFEAVMVKAIDANEWVNGKNAMRFLAFLTDNLGYIIKQTQLPEAAWNPEKSPCLLALPEDIRLRWALIAGIYNGAIQELSGVPDLVGLIAKYFYDPQVYTQINAMLAELSISGLVQSMGKAAVAHAALYKDPNIYKVHHQAGKDIFGIVSFLAPILKAGKVKNLADLRLVLLRMVDFRPSAQWLLQVAKKSALTLKQEGQKLLIYADRQATRLLASIENGMIRLEQTLDELSGGRLLGSFDEAQVITPDGRTITTKVELWEKDNKVYMKGDGKGSVGGLDWASLLNAKALQKLKSLQLDEQAEKLLFADLKDAKLRKAMNDEPELLEGWKALNKAKVDKFIRQSIDNLKKIQKYLYDNPTKTVQDIVDDIKYNGWQKWSNNISNTFRGVITEVDGKVIIRDELNNVVSIGSADSYKDYYLIKMTITTKGSSVSGRQTIRQTIKYMKEKWEQPIDGFLVNWKNIDNLTDNLDRFNLKYQKYINNGLSEKLAMEAAYWDTFSGKMAKELEFTTIHYIDGVKNSDGIFTSIEGVVTK